MYEGKWKFATALRSSELPLTMVVSISFLFFVYYGIRSQSQEQKETEVEMHDILMEQMVHEVTKLGVRELRTTDEVDALLAHEKGTVLIFVNSVCGCAGGIARPALGFAIRHSVKPDVIATVFASSDREATARAREYFTNMPPSSPSFGLLRNGKLIHMIHRSDIETRDAHQVAALLTTAFEKHCTTAAQD